MDKSLEKFMFKYGLDCSQGADCLTCELDNDTCGMRMRDGAEDKYPLFHKLVITRTEVRDERS